MWWNFAANLSRVVSRRAGLLQICVAVCTKQLIVRTHSPQILLLVKFLQRPLVSPKTQKWHVLDTNINFFESRTTLYFYPRTRCKRKKRILEIELSENQGQKTFELYWLCAAHPSRDTASIKPQDRLFKMSYWRWEPSTKFRLLINSKMFFEHNFVHFQTRLCRSSGHL